MRAAEGRSLRDRRGKRAVNEFFEKPLARAAGKCYTTRRFPPRGSSSVGRASRSQRGGREFESLLLHHPTETAGAARKRGRVFFCKRSAKESTMKIAIVGAAGRMGRMLVKLAGEDGNLDVVAEIDVADGFVREWPAGTEAVIDFSFHTAVPPSVEKAAAQGIPYVIGTTGLAPEEQAVVDAAAKKIPVVQSGNYSLGVNLLLNLVKTAAKVLGPEYDVEVVEMHHRHKKDRDLLSEKL